jgi:hypothetical protein
MTPSVVLSRSSPCNVPQGYASVAELPAALLGCHFEHPAGATLSIRCGLAQKYIDHAHNYALAVLEFTDDRDLDVGHGPSRCLTS